MNVNNFPYDNLKMIVDDYDKLRFKIKKWFILINTLFFLIRGILAALSDYSILPISNYHKYDIVYSYLHYINEKSYSQFIIITVFGFALALFFEIFIYFRPVHSLTFQSQYDMIVQIGRAHV